MIRPTVLRDAELWIRLHYVAGGRAVAFVAALALSLAIGVAPPTAYPLPASDRPVTLSSDGTASSAIVAPAAPRTGRWLVATHGRVTAHVYEYDGDAGPDPATLATIWDGSFTRVATSLGALPLSPDVRVDGFLYPDAPSFMLGTGDTRAIEGLAVPWTRRFHVIDREDAAVTAQHEMTHILSYYVFGRAGTTAMDEGLAVAVAGWSTSSLRGQAADMYRGGDLLPLAATLTDFRAEPGPVAYPEVGSFVRYLLAQRDVATLARLYASPDPMADFPRLYGTSLAQAEAAWLGTLAHAGPVTSE